MMGAYTRRDRKGIKDDIDHVFDHFPILKARKDQEAGHLSGGEQQMLAIGRALMSRPKLLMLDEPSLGLSPLLTRDIFTIIRDINQKDGVTILLVEQNVNMALKYANFAFLMENGRIVRAEKPGGPPGGRGCQGILSRHRQRDIGQGLPAVPSESRFGSRRFENHLVPRFRI